MRSILVGLLLCFQASAFAAVSPAVQAVTNDVNGLLEAVRAPTQNEQIAKLCHLIPQAVDLTTIGSELLGPVFSNMARDAAGITSFRTMMPSLIVSDFYGLVSDKGGSQFQVDPNTVPKGSTRVGVRVTLGGSNLIVTVNNSDNKIVDVEFGSISLIKSRKTEYQGVLNKENNKDPVNSKPVTALVTYLMNKGTIFRCN